MSTIVELLINAFQDFLPANHVGEPHLQTVLAEMRSVGAPQEVKANVPPVVRQYLAQSVELAAPQFAELTQMLLKLAPHLDWATMPPEYGGIELTRSYAGARLIGPPRSASRPTLYASQKISVGFTLQAPNLYYLPHRHKAIEFYGVLGGTGLWQKGDEAWSAKPPGSFIYHRSNIFHAMQTEAEPLLTIYAWVGDIFAPIETKDSRLQVMNQDL